MIDFSKQKNKKQRRIDLNPSSADRWTTCTASPQFIYDNWDKVPADTDTIYNREGTTAHEVGAAFLQDREPNEKDSYCCPVPINAEMRWHGWNYMEYVRGLRTPECKGILVEQKLPLWYMPERNAIVDAAVINVDSLHVIDFKYGAGIIVSTERNLQACIYAKSIVKALSLELSPDFPVFLHIYQPRGRAAEDSPSHTWETTYGEIETLASGIQGAADYIQHGSLFPDRDIVFKPSEKACQWCPAKGFCTARHGELTKDLEMLSTVEDKPLILPKTEAITLPQLAAIVKHGDAIVKWINDAKAYALTHMKAGGSIPGFKLVTSRGGNRYWRDPVKAGKMLIKETLLREDEVFEKKLIGPAAVEKMLGKNKMPVSVSNLIDKPPGQPVIAPEDDKRESCLLNGSSEFEVLDDSPFMGGIKEEYKEPSSYNLDEF